MKLNKIVCVVCVFTFLTFSLSVYADSLTYHFGSNHTKSIQNIGSLEESMQKAGVECDNYKYYSAKHGGIEFYDLECLGHSTLGSGFNDSIIPSGDGDTPSTIKTPIKKIWGTVTLILQICAVAGVIATGVRYMFTSAGGKADLKKSLIPLIIGIVIVFAAPTLVEFIVNVFEQIVQ